MEKRAGKSRLCRTIDSLALFQAVWISPPMTKLLRWPTEERRNGRVYPFQPVRCLKEITEEEKVGLGSNQCRGAVPGQWYASAQACQLVVSGPLRCREETDG